MDPNFNYEVINSIVSRVMAIEDTTLGTEKQGYIVRYRGRILNPDTSAAYDTLSDQLKSQNLTPLFRWDGGRHSILIVNGMPEVSKSDPRINLGLGFLTIISVLYAGSAYVTPGMTDDLFQNISIILGRGLPYFIESGWPFAVSMLAILAAHEFGHYLAGRHHGANVTLPYFIPMPFSPFGTMGAFINMKAPPKNRRILLDIGIAGPLAGLVVAIPVLFIGLYLSNVSQIVVPQGMQMSLEGNSILYLLAKYITFGHLLPEPASFAGVSPVLYWIRYFFTGQPLPLGALDVNLSPVAWAGWAGLLVTAMNLVPAGQLDGGHMLYVLLGREKAQKTFPFVVGALLLLSIAWLGWLLWAALIFLFGRVYAEPLDQVTPLDTRRKWLAVLALVIFLLVFTPIPLGVMVGG